MPAQSYDVIVVGGGFAGVTAARDLRVAGYTVLLLEARDRLGGRTYYRPFADTDQLVDFGGRWISPEVQPHLSTEIARYDIPLAEAGEPESFRWLVGGNLRSGPWPVPQEEMMDLERALYHIIHAARRIDFGAPLARQELADLDVSFADFIAPLRLPPATRDLLYSFIGFFMGTDPASLSALQPLAWVAGFRNSAWAWWAMMAHTFRDGTKSLIDAMIADGDPEIRLQTPVSHIKQGDEEVTVDTRTGESFAAAAVVLAAPIHVWRDIEFRPGLSRRKQEAAQEGHAGFSVNCWALVEDVPPNLVAVGHGGGLNWLSTEYSLPQGDILVGLGHSARLVDVGNSKDIETAIRQLVPDAKVIATDAHNWNADEFSRGTWVAYRPGQAMRFAHVLQEPEGRVLFAGSDLATGWVGWIDGAIESGARAARMARGVVAELRVAAPTT